jgi:hypothetical protein
MSAKFVGKWGPHGSSQPPLLDYVQMTAKEWKEAVKDKVRSRVIVQDALMNDILEILIGQKLQPRQNDVWETLIGRHGALEGNNDKARLACVLGLIKKETMQDMCSIHDIRNMFAHLAKPDSPDLIKKIKALSTVGNSKDEVTQANYMGFYDKAVGKCKEAIVEAMQQIVKERRPQGKHRGGGNRISLVDAVAEL